MSKSENIKFGISSGRNITFHYIDESDYTKEQWKSFSDSEKDDILQEYLYEQVQVWVDNEFEDQ